MKTCSISSSQISRYNRMDAAFFILVNEVEPRADELERTVDKDEALSFVLDTIDAFPAAGLIALSPLTSGQGDLSKKKLEDAVQKYPWIAMAVVEQILPGLVAAREKAFEEESAKLTALTERLSSHLPAKHSNKP